MNYKNYQLEGLIADQTFQDFVLKADPEASVFWLSWLRENPGKEDEFDQAVSLVKQLASAQEVVPVSYKEQELKKLLVAIHSQDLVPADQTGVVRHISFYQNTWFRVAAAVSGLILLTLLTRFVALNYLNATTQHQTAYGKTERIILPDQSVVILNGNTTIRYAAKWDNTTPRRVWLEGEAYFSVVHQPNNQKFIVNTGDGFNIEVLGTAFSVADRKIYNRVVLNSGKVKVNIQSKSRDQPAALILKPGELVEFKPGEDRILQKKVNAEAYTSWKDNVLVFDNTTMAEIAAILEEGYGLHLKIEDAALSGIKITGATSTNDLLNFLNGLARLHNFNIKKEGNNTIRLGVQTPA